MAVMMINGILPNEQAVTVYVKISKQKSFVDFVDDTTITKVFLRNLYHTSCVKRSIRRVL